MPTKIYGTISGGKDGAPELAPSDGFLCAVRGVFWFAETEELALATIANYVFGLRPDEGRHRKPPSIVPGQGALGYYADSGYIVRLPGGIIAVDLAGKVKEMGEVEHKGCFGFVLPVKKDDRLIESVETVSRI